RALRPSRLVAAAGSLRRVHAPSRTEGDRARGGCLDVLYSGLLLVAPQADRAGDRVCVARSDAIACRRLLDSLLPLRVAGGLLRRVLGAATLARARKRRRAARARASHGGGLRAHAGRVRPVPDA